MFYTEVLGAGKSIKSVNIESSKVETLKITHFEVVIDLAAFRFCIINGKKCSSAKSNTFPPLKDSDLLLVSNSSNSSIHLEKSFDDQDEEMLKILEELHLRNRKLQLWVSSITAEKNGHGSSPAQILWGGGPKNFRPK